MNVCSVLPSVCQIYEDKDKKKRRLRGSGFSREVPGVWNNDKYPYIHTYPLAKHSIHIAKSHRIVACHAMSYPA